MLVWLAAHSWFLPTVVSVGAVILLVWFIITVRGEDVMAGPIVLVFCLALILGSWGLFALWHLIRWLF